MDHQVEAWLTRDQVFLFFNRVMVSSFLVRLVENPSLNASIKVISKFYYESIVSLHELRHHQMDPVKS